MNRITFPILMLILSLATVLGWAAEPQSKAGDNDAVQLKGLQAERITVLTQLMEVVTAQHESGNADVAQVCSAWNELSNALVDSTDAPEKKVAVLTKQLDKANDFLKIEQARFDSGALSQADLLRAKSLHLGLKIKLLREHSRKGVVAAGKAGLPQAAAAKPAESPAKAKMGSPKPWNLPNGTTMWESTSVQGTPIHEEIHKLIAEKKYKFLKDYDGPNGEKEYVYRFNFSDGSSTATNFSMSLDHVSSWDDYQRKAEEQRQQRHEKINQAIKAGKSRLINLEVMQIHLCRDVATDQKFKVQRIGLGGGKEIAFPRTDYSAIPAGVKEATWQEHLRAIREGKRELLGLETTNSYTYEMISDDGTKIVFNYGGNEPLKKLEKKTE